MSNLFTKAEPFQPGKALEDVVIHPVFKLRFMCFEHFEQDSNLLGDAFGCDCFIAKPIEIENKSWLGIFNKNGLKNEDWFSWNAEVLAPFDSEIEEVFINKETNQPGLPKGGKASYIVFARKDGVRILYAHPKDISVKVGDFVKSGQVIGKVGSDGWSRNPHIHVGAWKDKQPLQIRFNLQMDCKLDHS